MNEKEIIIILEEILRVLKRIEKGIRTEDTFTIPQPEIETLILQYTEQGKELMAERKKEREELLSGMKKEVLRI